MTNLKTLIAAAFVAVSSTAAFASEANINLYDTKGSNQQIEGRNSAVAPTGSSEVGVSAYGFEARGPVMIEGRNSAIAPQGSSEVGVSIRG